MANANTIGAATRINGTLETDDDLTVEGRIEGGPVRVRGRLSVAARGIVLAEETEVREALIVGVFVGTLRAQDVVRIHQDGRIVGDVIAPRVVFVSDKPLSGEKAQSRPASSVPPRPPKTDEGGEASQDKDAEQSASQDGPRAVPALPTLGRHSMQRKE
jgi:cytoskeletal protein CcmA (bactofilin family)